MMDGFVIVNPGMFSTFQDLGRKGKQQIGLPVGGVMDMENAVMANALVGKTKSESVLEATMIGPEIRFLKSMSLGVTGSLKALINKLEIAKYQTVQVQAGDVLQLVPGRGSRGYIGFSDALVLDEAFGSYSTYVKGGLGGFAGRQLMRGDVVQVEVSAFEEVYCLSEPPRSKKIRIMVGLESDRFGDIEGLYEPYEITDEMDRMGIRLSGNEIRSEFSDIISSPVIPGTIQVPASGQPIIMMKDAQTIGGYARVGCVITPDLDHLAQVRPGDRIQFEAVSLEEAQSIRREYDGRLKALEAEKLKVKKYFKIGVNDQSFDVSLEEV